MNLSPALRALAVLLLVAPVAGCATAPRAEAPAAAVAAPAPVAAAPSDCPPQSETSDAARDLAEAQQLIEAAGEHPNDQQLSQIVERLRRASLAGNRDAQLRFGLYVVGYFLTDELFWPSDRATAVTALAMLRVALRRGAEGPEGWSGLARDPVAIEAEELTLLPKEWIDAAVAEADQWERCHP